MFPLQSQQGAEVEEVQEEGEIFSRKGDNVNPVSVTIILYSFIFLLRNCAFFLIVKIGDLVVFVFFAMFYFTFLM